MNASGKLVVRLLALGAVLVVAVLATTGCNTVRGVGEDVSAAGQGLADVAGDMNR